MKIIFKDQLLVELYDGTKVNNRMFRSNPKLISKFQLLILKLKQVNNISQLYQFHGLHYEKLKGNLNGYSSVRIDRQYRLIFREIIADINSDVVLEIIEISNHYT